MVLTQFGIKSAVDPIININLPDHETYVKMKETDAKTKEKLTKQLPLFVGDDIIQGEVEIRLNSAKKLEHLGIKIELVGQIGSLQLSRRDERQGHLEQLHVARQRPRAFWHALRRQDL